MASEKSMADHVDDLVAGVEKQLNGQLELLRFLCTCEVFDREAVSRFLTMCEDRGMYWDREDKESMLGAARLAPKLDGRGSVLDGFEQVREAQIEGIVDGLSKTLELFRTMEPGPEGQARLEKVEREIQGLVRRWRGGEGGEASAEPLEEPSTAADPEALPSGKEVRSRLARIRSLSALGGKKRFAIWIAVGYLAAMLAGWLVGPAVRFVLGTLEGFAATAFYLSSLPRIALLALLFAWLCTRRLADWQRVVGWGLAGVFGAVVYGSFFAALGPDPGTAPSVFDGEVLTWSFVWGALFMLGIVVPVRRWGIRPWSLMVGLTVANLGETFSWAMRGYVLNLSLVVSGALWGVVVGGVIFAGFFLHARAAAGLRTGGRPGLFDGFTLEEKRQLIGLSASYLEMEQKRRAGTLGMAVIDASDDKLGERLSDTELKALVEARSLGSQADQASGQEAIRLYERVLEIAPWDEISMMSIGVEYASAGDFGKAIPWLERALEANPGNSRVRGNLEAVRAAAR